MESFNQKICLSLPIIQLTVLIIISVINFNLTPINAHYVYSLPNTQRQYSPHHYNNNLLTTMPKNMQLRRFMWSNGDFYKDVTSGAHAMRQMMMGSFVQPSIMKFKNYFQHASSPSNQIKYIVRKPKKIVHIKKVIPKKVIKIVTIPTTQQSQPIIKPHPTKPTEYNKNQNIDNNDKDKYINPDHDHITPKDTLRMIEEEEERRVEATISALFPNHGHGSSHNDYNIVSGKIEGFDDSWKPIGIDGQYIDQPTRSHPVSPLHINVDDYVNLKGKKQHEKTSSSYDLNELHLKNQKNSEKIPYQKKSDKLPYEVTEISGEESMQLPQTFKPKKFESNRFTKDNVMISGRSSSSNIGSSSSTSTSSTNNNKIKSITTTTTSSTTTIAEKPNYPDYYLEAFPREYQVDCATKTPLIWKNTSKKDASSTKIPKKEKIIIQNTSTKPIIKKERQNNIQSVTTEKSAKLKPMRKYSSKIKKKTFRSTIKPQTKNNDEFPNDIQPHAIQKYITLKDDINDLQALPTSFTTRSPEDLFRYVTTTTSSSTTTTTSTQPSTTISSRSKLNKLVDRERMKKIRGAKKFGDKERY